MTSKIELNEQAVEAILLSEVCKRYNIKKEEVINYGIKYPNEFYIEFFLLEEESLPVAKESEEA